MTLPVVLLSTSTNQGLTGVTAGSVTAYYYRQGGSVTVISATGNWTELAATNMPGLYTLALPNAMWATGANYVMLHVRATGAYHYNQQFRIADDEHDRGIENSTAAYVVRARSVREALQRLRNRVGVNAGTMTVYRQDGTTGEWTAVVSVNPGDPITDINPA